jgi:predicted metal-dependent hydrolase
VRQARRDLEAAVARHAAHLGVRVRKITLRDTTSRWGSCTSSGELNFDLPLILWTPDQAAWRSACSGVIYPRAECSR